MNYPDQMLAYDRCLAKGELEAARTALFAAIDVTQSKLELDQMTLYRIALDAQIEAQKEQDPFIRINFEKLWQKMFGRKKADATFTGGKS